MPWVNAEGSTHIQSPRLPPHPGNVITSYYEPYVDAIIVDGLGCILGHATLFEPEERSLVDWTWSQISIVHCNVNLFNEAMYIVYSVYYTLKI